MAIDVTEQIAQAAERWLADKVLIDLLTKQEQAALELMGSTLDTNAMLRAQGGYKTLTEFRKFIEGAAKHAETFRAARNTRGNPTFEFPRNF